MNIFDGRRSFLAAVGLGVDQSTHIFGIKMSRKFIQFSVTSALILAVIIQSALCIIGYSQGFAAILLPFDMILTYLSAIVVYMSLNPENINKLLDCLQNVIDISANFFHYEYSLSSSIIYKFC